MSSLLIHITMKAICTLFLFLVPFFYSAQCPGSAITFTVDLSSKPDTVWQSIATSRSGYACGAISPSNSIAFITTINPLTTHIKLMLIGTLGPIEYYKIDCGNDLIVDNVPVCVPGPSTFCLSHSKPGNSVYIYEITAIRDTNFIPIDTGVTVTNSVITANQSAATYQWLDCNNAYASISTEIAQSYTASVNGNYAVQIALNGCKDTSDCVSINGLDVGFQSSTAPVYKMYPNPANETLNLELVDLNEKGVDVTIENIVGQIVYAAHLDNNSSTINLKLFEKGLYLINVKNEKGQSVKKFVKE